MSQESVELGALGRARLAKLCPPSPPRRSGGYRLTIVNPALAGTEAGAPITPAVSVAM
jgi:hypothetical protein